MTIIMKANPIQIGLSKELLKAQELGGGIQKSLY